jgi:DNA-binding transcriptional LysR family regulator
MPCIGFDLTGMSAPWRFPGPRGRDIDVAIRPRLTVTTAEAAVDAAVAGLGLTRILSYQAAEAVADGRLQVVLRAYEPEPLPVHLLHQAQGREPLRLRRFRDFLGPVLRGRLDGLARMP